ncbi:hypothetical protein H5410_031204 [Solanum commersonii]|uniref:Uncharacterized protein n=1 Tax=Solanum commersonii TaxID=4109 RepID=A0A9J5YHQ7_SOLCO|nr:hypothetical protein H5410_031204 [Solanum commersonii]
MDRMAREPDAHTVRRLRGVLCFYAPLSEAPFLREEFEANVEVDTRVGCHRRDAERSRPGCRLHAGHRRRH